LLGGHKHEVALGGLERRGGYLNDEMKLVKREDTSYVLQDELVEELHFEGLKTDVSS